MRHHPARTRRLRVTRYPDRQGERAAQLTWGGWALLALLGLLFYFL